MSDTPERGDRAAAIRYQAGDRVLMRHSEADVPAIVIQSRADGVWVEVLTYVNGYDGRPGSQAWVMADRLTRHPADPR